ncbi:MAG: Exodeoxyribonuclease 7 large subunit [Myxococcota bacterium]|nr:Exodeoxyribonuclease 7 large subunit [Myxococcota bacterium]
MTREAIFQTSGSRGNEGDDRRILSVGDLTSDLKALLERQFSRIWLAGEISNYTHHRSGHRYFSLKDDRAQIRAVMFSNSGAKLKFEPEDGMEVVVQGKISVYEPRGEYQIIVNQMEPRGVGALELAFRQLKDKLEREGLFDPARKRPLPPHPRIIGIVTSPTGAVVRDIIMVSRKRDAGQRLLICPAQVQGTAASPAIVEAIDRLSREPEVDIIIVARGGGSLEDLWPFNEEAVVRAVAACPIPVISAVGHETDFTLCDFAADLRAPTPSAAAETAVRDRAVLLREAAARRQFLANAMRDILQRRRLKSAMLARSLHDPRRILETWSRRIRQTRDRLTQMILFRQRRAVQGLRGLTEALERRHPGVILARQQEQRRQFQQRLERQMRRINQERRLRQASLTARLDAMSPLKVLGRGYAIALLLPERELLTTSDQARAGDLVEIRLNRGTLTAEVLGRDGESAEAAQRPGKPVRKKGGGDGPDQGNLF